MSNTGETTELRTGIYADIQNLQDIAQDVLVALVRRWPDNMPPPAKLNLYVRADHAHLWKVWATDAFAKIDVRVKGVQHYSLAATKNAADMAIAVDAISDFNHQRVSHVAVVSDDSDFISLYAKLAEETETLDSFIREDSVPFLWVLTDRSDTKSKLLHDFFPRSYVYIVDRNAAYYYDYDDEEDEPAVDVDEIEDSVPAEEPADSPSTNGRSQALKSEREVSMTERIALQLIREMPVGKFKSTDCQDIIRSSFPAHQLAAADGPAFGMIFRRDVLPFMQDRGVKEIGNKKPRQYEMTHEAKRSLARF